MTVFPEERKSRSEDTSKEALIRRRKLISMYSEVVGKRIKDIIGPITEHLDQVEGDFQSTNGPFEITGQVELNGPPGQELDRYTLRLKAMRDDTTAASMEIVRGSTRQEVVQTETLYGDDFRISVLKDKKGNAELELYEKKDERWTRKHKLDPTSKLDFDRALIQMGVISEELPDETPEEYRKLQDSYAELVGSRINGIIGSPALNMGSIESDFAIQNGEILTRATVTQSATATNKTIKVETLKHGVLLASKLRSIGIDTVENHTEPYDVLVDTLYGEDYRVTVVPDTQGMPRLYLSDRFYNTWTGACELSASSKPRFDDALEQMGFAPEEIPKTE